MRIVYWAHMDLAQAQLEQKLKEQGWAEVSVVETLDELEAALPGAIGLVTGDLPRKHIGDMARLLNAPPCTIRWVHIITASRSKFLQANPPARIVVTGPAGAHARTVAEHALAFLLSHTRQITAFAAMTKGGKWDRTATRRMSSLEGKTVCIVGTGYAGREVAKLAIAFGSQAIGVNRTVRPDPLFHDMLGLDAIVEAFGRSDYVVLTIAEAPETRHLLGAPEFAALPRHAYVVNVARGSIVDSRALHDALSEGRLAGAGIDVTDPEPLPDDHHLWDAPNLVISPHTSGGQSAASLERLAGRVLQNLQRLVEGNLRPS
ncbi:phosphoglycerate dehydrogenase [soil metagenome]